MNCSQPIEFKGVGKYFRDSDIFAIKCYNKIKRQNKFSNRKKIINILKRTSFYFSDVNKQ